MMYTALTQLEPILIEEVLGPQAAAQHAQGKIGKHFLEPVARALVELSTTFTSARADLSGNYWRGPGRAAYLLYYLPVNFAKAFVLLNELNTHPQALASFTLQPSSLKVVDVGCGPGTASLVTLFFLAGLDLQEPVAIEFTLVDKSSEALHLAKKLLLKATDVLNRDQTIVVPTIKLQLGPVTEFQKVSPLGKASLMWLGNVLNEQTQPLHHARWLKEFLLNHLADTGSAIIFEPALRETTRHLMHLRDELFHLAPELNVFAPCTADGVCRMLRDGQERDWCHSHIAWERPSLVTQLDTLTGLQKTSLKFSYLTLRRDGLRLQEVLSNRSAELWRVVGDALKEKGREKVLICGEKQLATLIRLKRDRSPSNQAFNRIKRGQLLECSQATISKQRHELHIHSNSELKAYGPFLTDR